MKLHDFLAEHAAFTFPLCDESRSTGTNSDISPTEVGLLEREWKAEHAIRDSTLVQKLCRTLENILGEISLATDDEDSLLDYFSPNLISKGSRAA